MEKELVELFEAAKKAADSASVDGASVGGPEESRCIDVLKQLKEFPVTYQLLVSTQVGKRLRILTKHPRNKIQASASELIEIWKKLITEETIKSKKIGISNGTGSKPFKTLNGKIEKSENPVLIKGEKTSTTETVKVERTDHGSSKKTVRAADLIMAEKKVDKVEVKVEKKKVECVQVERIAKEEKRPSDVKRPPSSSHPAPPKLTAMIKCHDELRDKVRESLFEGLSKVLGEVDDDLKSSVAACDPIRVAVSVESVMFEAWGRTNGAQKSRYRSIMFNMKDSKNPDFRRKVLLGLIDPSKIPTLTAAEMASDQRKSENEKLKEKALLECERGGPPKSTTDQFKCGKCGQRKTTYFQLQTRSADEPMTTFVTCVNCDNRWKFC
uniref:Transcription elongation factor n=1 Tax=Kalanchoe fedtschenkoi TaxID=63787 RepID=A0A7N0TCD7_KALFE